VLSPVENYGKVRILNVPHGADARTEMAGPANRAAEHERTLVVTDDRRLVDALTHGKAKVLSSAQFVARVRKSIRPDDEAAPDEPDEKFTGLTEEEADSWLGEFGEED